MKHALIIANTEYTDPSLRELYAPGKDAEDFARVLRSKEFAAFDHVTTMVNETAANLREAIDDFFYRKQTDDLLLLYFSGHGIKDEFGTLYLAVKNTKKSHLRSTAIDSSFIRLGMDQCQSIRQVIILDCCNSGAFPEGSKAEIGGSMGTSEAFQGRGVGRVVLTASDSTQYAWEGSNVTGDSSNSIFTEYLIKGLEGEADRDDDGKITVDDLYIYTYDQVTRRTTRQTPRKFTFAQQGEIAIRELTEEQRRIREELKKQNELKRQEEEKQRLAEEEEKRLATEIKIKQLQEERQNAESHARLIQEQIETEKKRREAAEIEFAQLANATDQPNKIVSNKQVDAKQSLIIKAVLPIAVTLIIAFGGYSIRKYISTPNSPDAVSTESGAETADSGSSNVVELPAEQPGFLLEPNSPIPENDLEVLSPDNVADLIPITRWGAPIIYELKFSPDGKTIASATSLGVSIYEADTLKILDTLDIASKVNSISFSPDGKKLLIGTELLGPQVWDLKSGELISSFFDRTSRSSVKGIAYSPDGSFIIVAYKFGDINIFDSTGSTLNTFNQITSSNTEGIAISPDGKSFGLVTKKYFGVWSVDTNGNIENIYTTDERLQNGHAIRFSPDGQNLLINDEYGGVSLWRASDGLLLNTTILSDAAFSPTEDLLVGGSWETSLEVIDKTTGISTQKFSGDEGLLKYISFSPDGKSILSSSNGKIIIWDVASKTIKLSEPDFSAQIYDFALSTDKTLMATQDGNSGTILIRDAISGEVLHEFTNLTEFYIMGMAFSSDNSTLIFAAGQSISFLDINSGTITRTIGSNSSELRPQGIALSADGNQLAYYTDSNNFKIVIISPNSGETITEFTDLSFVETGYSPYRLIFTPDGRNIITSGNSPEGIYIWDVASGQVIGKIFNADGFGYLYDGTIAYSIDSLIHIADMTGVDTSKTYTSPNILSDYMTLSPDKSLLMASTYDGYIHIWDTQNSTLLTSIKVGFEQYNDVRPIFSADGKKIIIAGLDGTLQFWGVK